MPKEARQVSTTLLIFEKVTIQGFGTQREIALIQETSTDLFRTSAKPDFLLNIVLRFLSQFLRLGFVPMALKGQTIRLFVAIASTSLVTTKFAEKVLWLRPIPIAMDLSDFPCFLMT